MSLFSNNALIGASAAGDYEIERSLRFNTGDSTYITRSVSSTGNRRTWTVSFWVKFCDVGGTNAQRFWSNESGDGNGDICKIEFYSGADANRQLSFIDNNHAGTGIRFTTQQSFKDPSSWYHIVVAVDTTQGTPSNRVKIYVNGEQVTVWSDEGSEHNHPPDQDYDTCVNLSGESNTWGRSFPFSSSSAAYFDGYLTEINFIDGSQLTPSSFGKTNIDTGQWIAKKYGGAYGTNGYYLNFSDNSNTTSTTLGKDSSGTGNNFTCNNFSVTADTAGNDSVSDTPTNNYPTLNPLHWCTLKGAGGTSLGDDYTQGNLRFVGPSSATSPYQRSAGGTITVSSGAWYFEVTIENFTNGNNIGVAEANNLDSNGDWASAGRWVWNCFDEQKNIAGTTSSYGTKPSNGDVIGCAVDIDNNTIEWFVNNSSQGKITSIGISGKLIVVGALMATFSNERYTINFGQQGFKYTPPTDFLALNTVNLPEPTIVESNKFLDVVGWTGTGSSKAITDLAFQPTKVVIKNRGADGNYGNYASDRGVQKELHWDTTDAEATEANGLTAFGANGFTVGSDNTVNQSGNAMIAYCWKKSTTAGFNSGTYTGNGTAGKTIAHGLGVTPQVVIVKIYDGGNDNWNVYNADIGAGRTAWIDTTSVVPCGDSNYYGYMWNSTAPDGTNFTLGSNGAVNASSKDYIWHAFTEVRGFSKFGKYEGNGNNDGPFIYCGFRPAFFLFKCTTETRNWFLLDELRPGFNTAAPIYFSPDDGSDDNGNSGAPIDFMSNGVKIRTNSVVRNNSGQTYFYMAFAKSPFKYANAR